MKNSILHVLAITFTIGMVSCDEGMVMDYIPNDGGHLSSEQIEKIAYGCDNYLDEEKSEEKLETRASENYLEMISQRLDSMNAVILSPRNLKDLTMEESWVGVVKEETCGSYDEVRIYYDCENTSCNTKILGYASDTQWKKTNNGNLEMRFCAVPSRFFKHIGQHYAVAFFSENIDTNEKSVNGNYVKMRTINLYMDAEDNSNKSKMYYTKYGENEIDISKERKYTHNTYIDKYGNLNLRLLYFSGEENVNNRTLPKLPFNYGVFGTLKNTATGSVYSDDQDHNNCNSAKLTIYAGPSYLYGTDVSINGVDYNSVVKTGGNTWFYISQIVSER